MIPDQLKEAQEEIVRLRALLAEFAECEQLRIQGDAACPKPYGQFSECPSCVARAQYKRRIAVVWEAVRALGETK